jgi:hypothetical protein
LLFYTEYLSCLKKMSKLPLMLKKYFLALKPSTIKQIKIFIL